MHPEIDLSPVDLRSHNFAMSKSSITKRICSLVVRPRSCSAILDAIDVIARLTQKMTMQARAVTRVALLVAVPIVIQIDLMIIKKEEAQHMQRDSSARITITCFKVPALTTKTSINKWSRTE